MTRRPLAPGGRGLLSLLLLGAFLWSLFAVDWGGRLVHPGGAAAIKEFFGALLRPSSPPRSSRSRSRQRGGRSLTRRPG